MAVGMELLYIARCRARRPRAEARAAGRRVLVQRVVHHREGGHDVGNSKIGDAAAAAAAVGAGVGGVAVAAHGRVLVNQIAGQCQVPLVVQAAAEAVAGQTREGRKEAPPLPPVATFRVNVLYETCDWMS